MTSALPKGWTLKRLDELVERRTDIVDGPFGSNLKSAHYTDEGARVVRLQNIGYGQFLDAEAFISLGHYETLRKHSVEEGDLLFASLGERLPRTCIAPNLNGPAIVKADCIRVRLAPGVNRRFVLFSTLRPDATRWADDAIHGLGRPRLGLAAIREFPIPWPDESEQQAIVEALDLQLSRLDVAESRVRALSIRLDKLKSSILRAAFDGDMSVKEMVPLGSLAQLSLGKMLDRKTATGLHPTPYLRNVNVRWHGFELSDLALMDIRPDEFDRVSLRQGDVVVCEGGEPGRASVWPFADKIAIQKALHRVRPGEDLLADYLVLYLDYLARSGLLTRHFTGTTIKHLPKERLAQIRVPAVSVEQQRRTVENLATALAPLGPLSRSLDVGLNRAVALRRALLHAAFSGQLTNASGGRHG